MRSFSPLPRRIAADAYETRIEDTIFHAQDLYDLDGETFLCSRDGRVETGFPEAFEQEV